MSEKNLRRLKRAFYALIVTSILILLTNSIVLFILNQLMTSNPTLKIIGIIRLILIILFLLLAILFFSLGAILLFLTLKSKVEGKLKVFLLLTGISPVGFLISVILHNLIYGLVGIEEPVFFIIAVFLCPIGFLIGAIGSIVLFRKGGRHSSHR